MIVPFIIAREPLRDFRLLFPSTSPLPLLFLIDASRGNVNCTGTGIGKGTDRGSGKGISCNVPSTPGGYGE